MDEENKNEEKSKVYVIPIQNGGELVDGYKTILMAKNDAPYFGEVVICSPCGIYLGKANLIKCFTPTELAHRVLDAKAVNHLPYVEGKIFFWCFEPVGVNFCEGDYVLDKADSFRGIITVIEGECAMVATRDGSRQAELNDLLMSHPGTEPNI